MLPGGRGHDIEERSLEMNPYAAPKATLAPPPMPGVSELERRKAGRGRRLGAVLLDGLFSLVWVVPLIIGAVLADQVKRGGSSSAVVVAISIGALLAIGLLVVNCVMLHQSGQTLGKRCLGIAIVRTDGSRCGLLRYIFARVVPVSLLGMIPFVGGFVSLLDALLIFNQERRCLHDMIADTIVIDV